jgi:hypothetical protein
MIGVVGIVFILVILALTKAALKDEDDFFEPKND